MVAPEEFHEQYGGMNGDRFSCFWFAWFLLSATTGFAGSFSQAEALELRGEFRAAGEVLSNALAGASGSERESLAFELERLERIRKDYPMTRAELFAALQESVRDLTEAEFENWIGQGRFDARTFDGEQRFMGSSVSNLFFRHPELESRRRPVQNRAEYERALLECVRMIRRTARTTGTPYVLPKHFRAVMALTVASNVVPSGETIRAWLPIPRQYPFQTDFKLRSTTGRGRQVAPESSPIRSIYLEQKSRENKPTTFRIAYDYTAFGVRFEVAEQKVQPCETNYLAFRPFLAEAPHVRFTAALKVLAYQIVGHETNDYVKARRCYDWIADNIQYSYALEYSTIRNLSEYCLTKRYGDCGQETLLFIALCRLNGIPARWQSGWFTFPGGQTIHDWCEIHLAPYGWLPVDPYMGIWATRYARSLSKAEQEEVRDFYFGGLDQWRMIANGDHNQPLAPRKRFLRSDPVDFQRGECEGGGQNLYFDQFDYGFQVKEISSR